MSFHQSPRRNKFGKNDYHKKKTEPYCNYFVLPSPVVLPKYPIPKDLVPVVMRNVQPFPGMTEKSKQFLLILEKLKSGEMQLSQSNHLQIFKLMLYVEEIQNNLDMRRYDQNEKKILKVTDDIFKVFVEGLMEERPSVRPGDIVEIRDSESRVLYLLKVMNVMDDHIIAVAGKHFCQNYNPGKSYNIRFKFPNYTMRCCHHALSLIKLYKLLPYFYPTKRPTISNQNSYQIWFNNEIENNPEQKQAVLNIVGKSSFPAPYILYGPPGTGKTATLVEAICQIWQNNPSDHILICTASNAAADVITKRLLSHIPENNLYRMYSPSKEGSQIDEEILGCSNSVNGQIMMFPEELVKIKKIVISTLCASMRLLAMKFREKHFSYVFIDEAGQATEPDSMIPFNLLSSEREERIGRLHGQVIIAGDPQQLGPGVRSKLTESILGRSMLERLMQLEPYKKNEHDRYNPSYITKLLRNYRSHPNIIQVSNELFYDNELMACGGTNIKVAEDWEHLPQKNFPLIFHGIEGSEMKDKKSPSVYNIEEIKIVMTYVKLLVGKKLKNKIVTQNDIGIVTPFSAQRLKLHRALEEENYGSIDVGTVELFQGQEKNIIILSTVRSKTFFHDERYHIGFLSNPKRFNVALTRAKCLLIIIGNPHVLQTDKYWHHLIKFCKNNNGCRGLNFDIQHKEELAPNICSLNEPKKYPGSSTFNYEVLEVVEVDDGVWESSDGSMVDENEYTSKQQEGKKSVKQQISHGNSSQIRSEPLLSDIIIQQMSEVKLAKQAAKKEKKQKKKKKHLDDEL